MSYGVLVMGLLTGTIPSDFSDIYENKGGIRGLPTALQAKLLFLNGPVPA